MGAPACCGAGAAPAHWRRKCARTQGSGAEAQNFNVCVAPDALALHYNRCRIGAVEQACAFCRLFGIVLREWYQMRERTRTPALLLAGYAGVLDGQHGWLLFHTQSVAVCVTSVKQFKSYVIDD